MAPITRTCKAASLALLALAATAPAFAARGAKADPLALYARARVADAIGDRATALPIYDRALTASPASASIAVRAYREAVEAGNERMALRAARTLDRLDSLPHDAAILLFLDEVRRSDWRAAEQRLDGIEASQSYAFMVAPMRAWMLLGAKKGDALAALDARVRDAIGYELMREQRALVQLATGQAQEGADAVRALNTRGVYRTQVRMMAAGQLGRLKRADLALALLEGEEAEFAAARAVIEKSLPLPEAVATPRAGLSELFARVALIMLAERAPQTALVMARFARFADPDRSHPRLVAAVVLNGNERHDDALAELAGLEERPLARRWAEQSRLEILQRADRKESALELAAAIAARPGASPDEHTRHGEALAALGRNRESAEAFARAIAVFAAARGESSVPWFLWLQQGRALELAGDWKAAKPLLQRAVDAAPEQATALNHLGYSMLENGDDPKIALEFLTRASAMRPDDAAITDSLGWAWVKRGELAKAIPLLEQAAEREPALGEISEHLGDAYWMAGRRVDARYAWRNALIQADGETAKRLETKLDQGLKPAS